MRLYDKVIKFIPHSHLVRNLSSTVQELQEGLHEYQIIFKPFDICRILALFELTRLEQVKKDF